MFGEGETQRQNLLAVPYAYTLHTAARRWLNGRLSDVGHVCIRSICARGDLTGGAEVKRQDVVLVASPRGSKIYVSYPQLWMPTSPVPKNNTVGTTVSSHQRLSAVRS